MGGMVLPEEDFTILYDLPPAFSIVLLAGLLWLVQQISLYSKLLHALHLSILGLRWHISYSSTPYHNSCNG